MWFPTLAGLWRSRPEPRPVRRRPLAARLAIEALEDRCVPAFLAPVTSAGGGVRLAVADFNHDGRDDIAALDGRILSSSPAPGGSATLDTVALSGKASVSLSNGDGTFQPPVFLVGAKGYYLASFAARDVNGDGNLDVWVSTFDRRYQTIRGWDFPSYESTRYDNLWLGKGDGTFGPVTVTSHPHTPVTFAGWPAWPPVVGNSLDTTADFNNDGIADLATVDGSTPVVSVSLSNADGTSQPAQTYAAGPSPGRVAAGDFNGDGWIDLVVVNSSSKLTVLLNDGTW